MKTSPKFRLGQRELSTATDSSVPLKAKVAMIIYNRQIEHAYNVIKYGALSFGFVYLNSMFSEYLFMHPLVMTALNFLVAGGFTYWLINSRKKMDLKNHEIICDLGLFTHRHGRPEVFNVEGPL